MTVPARPNNSINAVCELLCAEPCSTARDCMPSFTCLQTMNLKMNSLAAHAENSSTCCFPGACNEAPCILENRQARGVCTGSVTPPWPFVGRASPLLQKMHLPRFLLGPQIVAGAASSLQNLHASRRLPLLQPGNSGHRRRQDDEGASVERGQPGGRWAAIPGPESASPRTPEPVRSPPSICRRSSLTAGTTCWAVWPACSPSSC